MVTPARTAIESGIENQGQIGIAQHRGSRVEADVLEHRGERLDHDLFRVGERVDHQAEPAAVGIEHGNKVVPVAGQLRIRALASADGQERPAAADWPRSR